MPQLCLAVASLALSTSRPVSVVLLANRLSLVLPYLLWYHTLLSSAVVSKRTGILCHGIAPGVRRRYLSKGFDQRLNLHLHPWEVSRWNYLIPQPPEHKKTLFRQN